MTQNNLGAALQTLGERESGTARLDEAVAAYREALKEYTRQRAPLDWAMTQNNLELRLKLWASATRALTDLMRPSQRIAKHLRNERAIGYPATGPPRRTILATC